MKTLLVILSAAIIFLLIGGTLFAIYLVRWMKRRDKAQAELLKRMLERKQELESVRTLTANPK